MNQRALITGLVSAGLLTLGMSTPASATGVQLQDESFTGSSISASVALPTFPLGRGNSACLTASSQTSATPIPGCANPALNADGSGVLRLTSAATGKGGAVFSEEPIPTAAGLEVAFDSHQYGGTGADGISFILAAVDPDTGEPPATTGFFGGMLGYGPYAPHVLEGLPHGYLAFGLDPFGNFGHAPWASCTSEPGFTSAYVANPSSVTVRGPGNGARGYCALASTLTSSPTPTLRGANRAASKVPVRVTINHSDSAITNSGGVSVPAYSYAITFTGVGQSARTISGSLPDMTGYAPEEWLDEHGVPLQISYGWVGSTGGSTDVHEVASFTADSVDPIPVLDASLSYTGDFGVESGTGTFTANSRLSAQSAPLSGPVTVSGAVPSQMTIDSASGIGWDCATPTLSTYSCTRTLTSTPPGTELSPVTVDVSFSSEVTRQAITASSLRVLADNAQTDLAYAPLPEVRDQAITFNSLEDKYRMESPLTVSATASSGLDVSFTTTTPEVCTSGGSQGSTITLVGTGTCTVQANQPGHVSYHAAEPVEQSFIVDPNNPPQPTSLTCIDRILQWPSVRRASSYFVVYRVKGSTKPWGVYTAGSGQTTASLSNPGPKKRCSATNLTRGHNNCAMPYGWSAGTIYEFAVYAKNTINRSTVVPLVSQLTYEASAGTKPPTPTDLIAEALDGSARIEFTVGSQCTATTTSIQYRVNNGAWTAADPDGPITITGLTNGQEYSVRLRPVGPTGTGTATAPITVTPTIPAPTGLSSTAGNGTLGIAFTAPESVAVTNYEYRLDNGDWTALSPADTTSPISLTGLTNSQDYAVRLRAVSANGPGTASAQVYGRPTTSNVAPVARIVGANTGLSGSNQIGTDDDGNIYVADLNNSAIRVFAKGANGNVTPVRSITGSETGLSSPNGVAIGPDGSIFTTNNGNQSVRVFAANASGNVAPIRVISGSNTGLAWPYYMDVDADGKVYVANRNNHSIRVFAANASGNVAPARTIEGSNTLLNLPLGVRVGGDGTVYVANDTASVNVYAPNASGNVAPTRRITGSNTGFSQLYGIAVSDSGVIYTMDRPNKRISAFGPSADGNVAPTRTINGALTLFSDPVGLHWAPDEHGLGGKLYVGDRGAFSVNVYAP